MQLEDLIMDFNGQKCTLNGVTYILLPDEVKAGEVAEGVFCVPFNLMRADGTIEEGFDLAGIYIAPGCHTPLQRVIEPGSETSECYFFGEGEIHLKRKDQKDWEVVDLSSNNIVTLHLDDEVQLFAHGDGMIFIEFCSPKFSENRFAVVNEQ